MNNKYLIIILGPTAVGKTAIAISVAQHLHTEIISADSRQFYKEMKIGTAVPSDEELQTVTHHFIQSLSIFDNYNAGKFELDAVKFLDDFLKLNQTAVMVGGSGLYINAICQGIDALPRTDPNIRNQLLEKFQQEGIEGLRMQLKKVDPDYYQNVDLKNPQRILKGLEVYAMTGKPYSSFLTKPEKKRAFKTIKIGLNLPREELYEKINLRVDQMMKKGLLQEVKELQKYKGNNALNTVGYKELFRYLDGEIDLNKAVELIKKNSRNYARRQLTWFNKDQDIQWFHPDDVDEITAHLFTLIN